MGAKLENLPKLENCYNTEKLKKVWKRKLHLCETHFPFLSEDEHDNSVEDSWRSDIDVHGGTEEEMRGRRLKSSTLQELAEFIDPRRTKDLREFFEDKDCVDSVKMFVVAHINRELPFVPVTFCPMKDDLCPEPSWPHLQYVYEICLRTVRNIHANEKQLAFMSKDLLSHLINKVQSNDSRERTCSLEVIRTALVKASDELENVILSHVVEALQLYAYERRAYCLGVTGLMELCSIVVQKRRPNTILPQPPLETARSLTDSFIRVMLHCCRAPVKNLPVPLTLSFL